MKGFYSVLIGVTVLFVLATALFTVNSFNKSQALIPQKESFGYITKQWQNAQRLVDKSVSDAVIDSGFSATCLTASFNPDLNIYSYSQNTLLSMNADCIASNFVVSKTGPINSVHSVGERNIYDVNVRIDLKCMHRMEIGLDLNSLVSYDKNVLFEKTVDANYRTDNQDCNIFVIDKQSNMMDVNYFIS